MSRFRTSCSWQKLVLLWVGRIYSCFNNFGLKETGTRLIKLHGLIQQQGRVFRCWCVCTGPVWCLSDLRLAGRQWCLNPDHYPGSEPACSFLTLMCWEEQLRQGSSLTWPGIEPPTSRIGLLWMTDIQCIQCTQLKANSEFDWVCHEGKLWTVTRKKNSSFIVFICKLYFLSCNVCYFFQVIIRCSRRMAKGNSG